ncbi:hypothetical protein [Erythrobacter rubeus]|uniref:PH domain-containing protein n=1 Tax=Erythrobacter rubeus TaxID=2760803 RepID=A0ABR8KMR2_9SPHN|nr:hypothetical protein [Erythrobacter rubeus]MBD2841851.1 hypothetical protein [Erythrobacter rubeus]
MTSSLPAPLLKILPILLPLIAIVGARLATYSSWAMANSGIAAALYAWIVTDALLLGLIAKSPDRKPELFQVVGVVSLASAVIIIGASEPLREVYLDLPHVLVAAAATAGLFALWSSFRIVVGWRSSGSLVAGFEQVLPEKLVHLVVSECRVLWLALFRWRAPVDVPSGAKAFAYHTYLTPMIATFVALQVIELGVVHLLLMLWNPVVAWIVFGLSMWGLIWTIALLKSFRINPVLVAPGAVRVRSGMIYDFVVPVGSIAETRSAFSSGELERKDVINLAIMSSPNVSLRFSEPVMIRTFTGGQRPISGVALRLDESAEFLAELDRAAKFER